MLRILLAEDDESMRTYLVRALERVGYEVVAVDRGTDAVPLLQAARFDLLLSDIVMPEMDGIELAQKAGEIQPGIRVMFITGFAAVALKAGRKTPDAKVLSKPFHLRELVAEVERMFMTEDQEYFCLPFAALRLCVTAFLFCSREAAKAQRGKGGAARRAPSQGPVLRSFLDACAELSRICG